MKKLLFTLLVVSPYLLFAQGNTEEKKNAYHHMVNSLIDHTVPEVKVEDDFSKNTIWLDAREKNEYKVSHIKDAVYVGYDYFNLNAVKDMPKDSEIVVYCSVGYRSEKIAEKLIDAGYTNVSNLYGGIFEWSNESKPVLNKSGELTKKVHGYDKTWGAWLNEAEVVFK